MDNIAIIITKLNGGGAERTASNLSIELSKWYNVYLIVFDGSNITYPYKGTLIDLTVPNSNSTAMRVVNEVKRIRAVKRIKKSRNIKCSISLLDGPNIVNVLSHHKEKVIVSVRNMLSSERPSFLRRMLIRMCSRRADLTVALSKMVKKDLIQEFGVDENKIKTIYNHCDPELLYSLVDKEPKPSFIHEDNVYIITIGRLNYQKGQWHLIRAFKGVIDVIPNAYLVIVGEGELREKLENLAKCLNISEHVIFTGYLKKPHILMKYSELFVFPSQFEGLGNVLLEAMAFHLPVISTDCIAGPREILAPNTLLDAKAAKMVKEEFGILVPVMGLEHFNSEDPLDEDETELQKAIIEMHKSDKLRHYYEEASARRIEDFSKDKVMEMWKQCIDEN